MQIENTIKHSTNSIDKFDAELLLAFAFGKNREFIIAHQNEKVPFGVKLKFLYFVFQRKHGYSVAAITKHKEFFGLDFFVNKNVLIPRPDTEIMIEKVIKITKPKTTLIDVGTGSGCIPIAIAKNTELKKIIAIDISNKALKVAKKNAKKHNIAIEFIKSNLLSKVRAIPQHTVITANLPYLTKEQFKTEKTIQKEPKKALVAKDDGLFFYKKLLEELKQKNAPKGTAVFLEIEPTQKQKIKKMIWQIFPKAKIYIYKDLKGLERVVKVVI